jgi:hypothetical protein
MRNASIEMIWITLSMNRTFSNLAQATCSASFKSCCNLNSADHSRICKHKKRIHTRTHTPAYLSQVEDYELQVLKSDKITPVNFICFKEDD